MEEDWPDPTAIRKWRMDLHITQQDLAKLSGIAQPVISRVEEGETADPSYNTVRSLFRALLRYEKSGKKKDEAPMLYADDVMNRNVISVKPEDPAKKAWKLMQTHDFSQLPVIDERHRIVGGITDSNLLSGDTNALVKDVMGDTFPVVGTETSLPELAKMVRSHHAVLVMSKGKMLGIVTAYDLVFNAYEKDRDSLG
jgi:predicted transcriptional regulator